MIRMVANAISVGLIDVAKRAGVSVSTASKALNGKRDVSAETVERVENAARELNYRPNPIARGLGSGSTGTVGILTSDLEGRFALPILMGVEDAFGMDRVLTFLCDARGDEVREARLVELLLEHRVDGIVVVGRQPDPRPPIRDLPVPVVYAYAPSQVESDCSVVVDNVAIGRLAAEHLLASGRRRIAHVSGEVGHGAALERFRGFSERLHADSLAPVGEPLFGLWTEQWGREATRRILGSGEQVDAVFCASDQLARGAIDALVEAGLDVPGDVAVIGVDNWEVIAEGASVPLTTIDMRLQRLGRVAASQLASAIGGELQSGITRLEGVVVHRRSTIPSFS